MVATEVSIGHITPSVISRILSIFNSLGWRIHQEFVGIESYERTFNQFCELLYLLNEEEQELILQLTEDFLHCPYFRYPDLMQRALNEIPHPYLDECNKVYLIPLLSPKDEDKVKSSSQLYSFLHTTITQVPHVNRKFHKAYLKPELLKTNHNSRDNALVLLFDDFIGTGNQALEALNYYNDEIRVEGDKPIVVALVAQERGIEEINNLGIEIVTAIRRSRCISDSVKISNKIKAIRIMRRIEKRIGVNPNFKLGYERSQALVSMIRTPNNTLPVYWWSKTQLGASWPAPFRR